MVAAVWAFALRPNVKPVAKASRGHKKLGSFCKEYLDMSRSSLLFIVNVVLLVDNSTIDGKYFLSGEAYDFGAL